MGCKWFADGVIWWAGGAGKAGGARGTVQTFTKQGQLENMWMWTCGMVGV